MILPSQGRWQHKVLTEGCHSLAGGTRSAPNTAPNTALQWGV